jgi:hypothetical protein
MSDSEGGAVTDVCAIAHPLADAKLAKKVLKVVKKGTQPPQAVRSIVRTSERRHLAPQRRKRSACVAA